MLLVDLNKEITPKCTLSYYAALVSSLQLVAELRDLVLLASEKLPMGPGDQELILPAPGKAEGPGQNQILFAFSSPMPTS